MQFKYTFDLDRDITGKRTHANGTPHPYSIIRSPDLREQLAAAIDDKGMPLEIGCAADHAKRLHDTLYFIEAAEITAHGRQNGEPYLARRQLTLVGVEFLADAADDQCAVTAYGPMTGYI